MKADVMLMLLLCFACRIGSSETLSDNLQYFAQPAVEISDDRISLNLPRSMNSVPDRVRNVRPNCFLVEQRA